MFVEQIRLSPCSETKIDGLEYIFSILLDYKADVWQIEYGKVLYSERQVDFLRENNYPENGVRHRHFRYTDDFGTGCRRPYRAGANFPVLATRQIGNPQRSRNNGGRYNRFMRSPR